MEKNKLNEKEVYGEVLEKIANSIEVTPPQVPVEKPKQTESLITAEDIKNFINNKKNN